MRKDRGFNELFGKSDRLREIQFIQFFQAFSAIALFGNPKRIEKDLFGHAVRA